MAFTAYSPTPTSPATPSAGGFTPYTPPAPTASVSPSHPPDSFLSMVGKGAVNALNAVEKPIIGLGAAPFQGAIAGLNAIGGTHIPDPYANGFPGIGGSNIPVTPLNAEAKLGDAAQVGSYFVPGSGVLGAAGMGALQGAGSAMSDQKDLGDIATGGIIGAGVGAAAGGAAKLLGKGIGALGSLATGETAQTAKEGIRDAYGQALNLNASQRAYENRSGKDLAQVLVNHAAPLSRNPDGTLNATGAIPKLHTALKPLNAEAEAILNGSTAKVNLHDIAAGAKNDITQKATTALDQRSANSGIEAYINAEIEKRTGDIAQATYGKTFDQLSRQQQAKIAFDAANPSVVEADKIKQAFWNSSFDRNRSDLQNHIPYQIGTNIKDAIEKAVPDAALGQVNQERGHLIDAIRRLTEMDGVKAVKGGRLGNIMGGVVGGITGAASGLGPLAVVGGDYFGSKAAELLNNPATEIGIANAKADSFSGLAKAFGSNGAKIGAGLKTAGNAVSKGARAVGLGSNLFTSK